MSRPKSEHSAEHAIWPFRFDTTLLSADTKDLESADSGP
jgi:hypothetical protein